MFTHDSPRIRAVGVLLGSTLAWVLIAGLPSVAQGQEVRLARNEKATEQAIAASLIADIYQRAGLSAKVQALPAARANAQALSGEVGGEVARVQGYATKNASLIKVEPAYYALTTAAFAKAGRGITITSKEDLKKYRVAIIRGVAHTRDATADLTGTLHAVGTAEQIYLMLDAGRVDVALDAGVNGPYVIQKLGLKGLAHVGDVARLELFNILSPANSALAPRISDAIQALKDAGELEALAKKHEDAFLSGGTTP